MTNWQERAAGLDADTRTSALTALLADVARAGGELALSFFRPGATTSANVRHKEGGSPVTEADIAVDVLLRRRLRTLVPDAGWLSEETVDSRERLTHRRVLIVDPIDGTRAYAAGDARWAVSIALVEDGRPVAGVVHAPAMGDTFVATLGGGAYLNGARIGVSRRAGFDELTTLAATVPTAAELHGAGLSFTPQPRVPSLAVRLVGVACGRFDAGVAGENAHDWDIAAADLILHEAGGRLTDLEGQAPRYNQEKTRHGLLLAAPTQIHAQLVGAARRARRLEVR
jgi:myo-inositol-1(or 4)-monophosphatase